MYTKSGVEILRNLYKQPIVDITKIQEWTRFTRAGAQKVVDRFVQLGILTQRNLNKNYARTYEYKSYLGLFENNSNH